MSTSASSAMRSPGAGWASQGTACIAGRPRRLRVGASAGRQEGSLGPPSMESGLTDFRPSFPGRVKQPRISSYEWMRIRGTSIRHVYMRGHGIYVCVSGSLAPQPARVVVGHQLPVLLRGNGMYPSMCGTSRFDHPSEVRQNRPVSVVVSVSIPSRCLDVQ